MKLRTRCFLYLTLIGLFPFVVVTVLYPLFRPQDGLTSLKIPETWSWGGWLVLILTVLMLGAAVLSLGFLICAAFKKRIQNLAGFLVAASSGLIPEVKATEINDEYASFRQSLVDIFQQVRKSRAEIEEKYRRQQISYMNLEEKYAQTYTVQLIQEEISRELDTDQLLAKTTDIVMGVFGSKRCAIYLVNEANEALISKTDSGSIVSISHPNSILLAANNIIAKSCRDKKVYTEIDAEPDELAELNARNSFSVLSIPLTARGNCLGVMVLEHELAGGLSSDLVDFAKRIAQELSFSVENAYLYEKMLYMATHDALTGIYNRSHLMNYMNEVFTSKPSTVSIIIFDMDHFKNINDKYGHLAGDMVLKTTALLIQKKLLTGIIARYGGEEFMIVLPEVNQADGYQLANQLRQLVNDHSFITADGVRVKVSFSAGLANYPVVSDNYETMMYLADEALYEAKNSGRNMVCVASPPN